MKINYYHDAHILECIIDELVKDIPADCVVRNELNGKRHLHDPSQIVRAMVQDPYSKPPVMPRIFPEGTWNVYKPRMRTNPYLAPYFIPTDAEQYLPVWELDENGGYDHVTDKHVLDIGYGMHFSTGRTTVGCIRVMDERDLLWLVRKVSDEILEGHPVMLAV